MRGSVTIRQNVPHVLLASSLGFSPRALGGRSPMPLGLWVSNSLGLPFWLMENALGAVGEMEATLQKEVETSRDKAQYRGEASGLGP